MNETEILFTKVLNCDRNSLYLRKDIALDKEKRLMISSALKRRFSGEPIQYILGESEFMGLNFKVNPDVLIPRPETELLVESAIEIASCARHNALAGVRQRFVKDVMRYASCVNILDLGTGSGCIAISLAKLLPGVEIDAVDVSEKALAVARENARLHNTEINFFQSDLFSAYDLQPITYDLIVSNPPYIRSSDIDKLQPEVKFEPHVALDGGKDGLNFYREIINKAPVYLKKDGYLILEIGFDQCAGIRKILQNSLNFEIIEVVQDYNNIDRVIVVRRRSASPLNK